MKGTGIGRRLWRRMRLRLAGRSPHDEAIDLALSRLQTDVNLLLRRQEHVQEALGRIEDRQLEERDYHGLRQNEYRVYSQWGEDGIIQYLLRHVPVAQRVFVEFGVEDYSEANTRFLLVNNNWTGLVIDRDEQAVARLARSRAGLNYGLRAVNAFVTAENIDDILKPCEVEGEIGLLSIDLDGNDFWVWRAITVIQPTIVVIEYNPLFGAERAVTVPYSTDFNRAKAHPSMTYYGASLKALCRLGEQKGYAFVGCNSNGVNAFFVRRDRKPDSVAELSVGEGFVRGTYCEFRDEFGRHVRVPEEVEKSALAGLPLVEVSTTGTV